MRTSQRLRLAARLVSSEKVRYSCIAIDKTYKGDKYEFTHSPLTKWYGWMFGTEKNRLMVSDVYYAMDGNRERQRDFRVLLLCMASAVAETEIISK